MKDCHCHPAGNKSDAVYGLGVVGSLFYFLPQAVGFTGTIMAILKSVLWPAYLVYSCLTFFKVL